MEPAPRYGLFGYARGIGATIGRTAIAISASGYDLPSTSSLVPVIPRREFLQVSALTGAAVWLASHGIRPAYSSETAPKTAEISRVGDGFSLEGTYFGAEGGLNVEEIITLRDGWNDAFQKGENRMEHNVIYSTEIVREKDFNPTDFAWSDLGYDNFQAYLRAEYDEINRVLIEAGLNLRIECRRVMVVQDGISVPISGSWHGGWFENEGIHDCDGAWGIWDDSPGAHDPRLAPYWDPIRRLDYTANHERMHTIFHVPDLYCLSYNFSVQSQGFSDETIRLLFAEVSLMKNKKLFMKLKPYLRQIFIEANRDPNDIEKIGKMSQEEISAIIQKRRYNLDERNKKANITAAAPSCFDGIPLEWQEYSLGLRIGDGRGPYRDGSGKLYNGGIMDYGCWYPPPKVDRFTWWYFQKRKDRGKVHGIDTLKEEGWYYTPEVATKNKLRVSSEWDGAQVEVWRSAGTETERRLDKISGGLTVVDGLVDIGNPFSSVRLSPEGYILVADALIMVKFTVRDGEGVITKTGIRYLDIGDFQAGLSTFSPANNLSTLTIDLKVADVSVDTDQEAFDWRISYSQNWPGLLYIPIIYQNSTYRTPPTTDGLVFP
ncbi:hypothetical protein MUP32_02155 [Candidatus Microgenomates bacterium]|nr:hypothetical protein [Candidatus Microgenomates bacterium]